MVEGVLRARSLQTIGAEIGMPGLDKEIILETDSSAAKSFVARFLWLQFEVLEKKVRVLKVKGEDNPADLLTKFLPEAAISKCLKRVNVDIA